MAFFVKRLYKKADGFVFQTSDAMKFYDGAINCKTAVIENPINDIFLNHKKAKTRRKNAVSCGRLEKQKNYGLLIDAFADVVKLYPDYTLEIYGEGSKKEELKGLSRKLGIDNKVLFKGRADNIADEIADAGVFVMSSDYEGMPNALMEAMALGIPCISTDCPVGGPKVLIGKDENGILVDMGDKKALANAILRVIGDKELASELSKNGATVSKMYSVDIIVGRWMSFINDVVGRC